MKKRLLLIIAIVVAVIVFLSLGIGGFFYFKNRIDPKYHGTYVRYYYYDGIESKTTYIIKALSIKEIEEEDGKKTEYKYDYYKKGDDLIIKRDDDENYIIVEDGKLYIDSSKEDGLSKSLDIYYWNEKGDKADIYEIINKSHVLENKIEETMDEWAQEYVYEVYDYNDGNSTFYITSSDEKTDETDLNTIKVAYKAAGGELTFYYNRKTKNINKISYSGKILSSSKLDSMSIDDIYDSKGIVLSLMYILGNKDNIKLNQDILEAGESDDARKDLIYRTNVFTEFKNLFSNRETDPDFTDKYTFSLNNDKYDIKYDSWITVLTYSASGLVSFDMTIK